ncbi:MAG: PIG-L deacetylase family protein [Candidatus Jordarchaeaceae archaeon]
MNKRIVIFAPHPDDETLACGGTIAKKLNEGYDVFLVFLTDGRNSLKETGISSDPSPLELKEIRKDEAKRAARVLGISQKNLIFADIEDGDLQKNENLAHEIINDVLSNFPEIVFFPQEKEFHIDHRVTNRLIRNAIERLNFHPFQYQYAIAWQYPLNLMPRLPEVMQNAIVSTFFKKEIVQIDISDFLPIKIAALKEYKSQLKILSSKQRRPVLRDSFVKMFLKGKEKFFLNK